MSPAPRAIPARIVLLRPRDPENLGAVARAMKNFGLAEWAVVDLGTHDFASSRRVAVHAEELLDRPRLVRTLDEAVADCAWVVGTSSRRVRRAPRLAPDEVARGAWERAADGPTAIVFGEERAGLTNAEERRCHHLSVISADEAQPSLNLAQAVLVYAYELARTRPSSPPAPERRGGATDAELVALEAALREALRGAGFLAGPERHAVRDLASALRRARLSTREARIWMAAIRTLGRR